MKLLFISAFITSFFCFNTHRKSIFSNSKHQKSDTLIPLYITEDLKQLTTLTKSIMNAFHIQIRPNVKMDGALKFEVMELGGNFVGRFYVEDYSLVDNKVELRYYKNPLLLIRPNIDTLLKMGFSKGQGNYVVAVSVIVHELTHYLQSTLPMEETQDTMKFSNIENRRKYVRKPEEFEAHAVGGYYSLYYLKRAVLEYIMMQDLPDESKMKWIINAEDAILYPGSGAIFPEEYHPLPYYLNN